MASRKEEKERRRQERIARERAEREAARRKRVYSVVAGSVLSVAAVVAVVIAVSASGGGGGGSGAYGYSTRAKDTLMPPAQRISNLFQAAKNPPCVLRSPPIEDRTTCLTPAKYPTRP